MHLGMPECHKPFWGHCDLDLWPSFQKLLCPEHISYIIWCRNPKFGVVIALGMAEWCILFWVTLTLTLTSGLISRFFMLYYSYLSSNVSYARPIPLGAFVTCLWHFLSFIESSVFEQQVLFGTDFLCVTSDIRAHDPMWGKRSKSRTPLKFYYIFSDLWGYFKESIRKPSYLGICYHSWQAFTQHLGSCRRVRLEVQI